MKKLKLFSLALMALFVTSAWGATETTTNTGSKDTDVALTSFTIKGTYVADKGSGGANLPNKGIKVRLNKTSTAYSSTSWGDDNLNLEISVNENYKLTAFTFYLTTNDGSKTAIIDGIYVDGVAYEGSYGTTVPGYNASNCLQVDLTGIEATTAITIHFSTLNNNQGRLVCTATYEQLVECTDPEIAWSTEPTGGEVGDEDFVASVTTTPADHAVTWTSSNTAAATVNNGTIHYVGSGSTTITASLTYTGDDFCKKTVSVSKDILVPISYDTPGENDKVWYYQSAVPAGSPDNGLTFNNGTKSGKGMYGIKLNSSGYAWFVKPAVAGTLRVGAYSPDLNAAYEVNVFACDEEGAKSGDALGTLSTASAGAASATMDIAADVERIRIERKTSNEGILYFIEFKGEAPCAATVPGDISKGTLSAGNLTLTAAGSPEEGDVWYWQDAADGTATDKGTGASKTVNAAGTYYIRSFNEDADCWSSAKSIEVVAADLVANYTVIYKDGETELDREVVAVSGHPEGIDDPTKEFYTFAGWEYNSSAVVPTEFVGEEGQTYNFMATWTAKYLLANTTIDFEEGGASLVSNVADYNIIASNAGTYDGGKEEENWAYKGWKIKSAGATVRFLVPAYKYIQFKFGYLNVAGTVTISGDDTPKEVTGASNEAGNPLKYKTYTYQKDYDAIYTFTTGDKNAAVIKAIKMTDADPTALDNTDASVKAVKVLRDGQIFIEKNGHVYNVFGTCVK